jgi:uncharacterized lipoprotein YajG
MKKLIILTLGVLAVSGCATQEKTRSLDMKGAYVSDSGKLAVGSVKIQSAKAGAEAAMISYTESVPLFSEEKERNVHVTLSGTNSCQSAAKIVRDICNAFTAVAVTTNGVSAVK